MTTETTQNVVPFPHSDPAPAATPDAAASTLPEDDPQEWCYPHDDNDEFALRLLVGEILEHDQELAEILVDTTIGATPQAELMRRIERWRSGSPAEPAPTAPEPAPWLV